MVADLQRLIGEDAVLSGPAAERGYDCDAYTVDRSRPAVVVLPRTTAEVAEIVRYCAENNIPFTARGAGTGLSGGVLPAFGGVVISTKRMTAILEIDIENRVMRAQAGIANKRLSDAVKHAGLHFAPDPSSQTVSTLGGNIGENAGGPHTLKYGVTAPHILGLTMVEPGGEIVEFGGPVTGSPGSEFVSLIVGSEGTMGVVTEAWIKLTPLPKSVKTALAAFSDVRHATEAVAKIIGAGIIPAALEMMDHGILGAIKAAFGLDYPEGTRAMLLVECDSDLDSITAAEMAEVRAICVSFGALSFVEASDEAERQKLWVARKKGVGAMGRIAPTVVTHDGVIPRSKLPEMLDTVYAVSEEFGIGVANIFHAGDGNLHPCFYFDDRDPDQVRRVILAGEKVIMRCLELGGSITGEHGIGVEKIDLMSHMFTPEDLAYQSMVKAIFSDGRLCNPCKVLPSQKGCTEHRARWRGMAW